MAPAAEYRPTSVKEQSKSYTALKKICSLIAYPFHLITTLCLKNLTAKYCH